MVIHYWGRTRTSGRFKLVREGERNMANRSDSTALENGITSEEAAQERPKPKYPGLRVTCNGNHLVGYHTECRVADGGIFYPITPSTELGETYQQSYAEGGLNVWGEQKLAVECEGEHAAQGGAIAYSVTGRRVANFTSGQGIVYAIEQYYHAPGKLSTLVVEVGDARGVCVAEPPQMALRGLAQGLECALVVEANAPARRSATAARAAAARSAASALSAR